MGFEDDPFRDEDGEPLMDYDDFNNDREPTPEPLQDFDDNLADDVGEWNAGEGSQTPVYDNDKVKPRKRLVKKTSGGQGTMDVPELVDEDLDFDGDEFAGRGSDFDDKVGKKRKEKEWISSSGKKEKKQMKFTSRGERKSAEIDEMWNSIAHNPEIDEEGVRTVDDDNFIDDSGLDPSERYGHDHGGHSPSHYPEAEEGEEDDEINQLFKVGKKKKKNEKNPAEIALLVENVMAELELTAEEDADLNRQGKPAVNKLKKLPLLTEVLAKKQLQSEFLDHGVLTLLKNWLEPLPDGSLPNINIRAAILKILTDFPIDLDQYDRREQLKNSGLGKVIMFLSKSDEETTSNRRLAKDLVDKWSRPIFNKSTRFEDMRNVDEDRVPYRRPSSKKPVNKASAMESRDGDFDLDIRNRKTGLTSGQSSSSRQVTVRPEATPLDFVIRPQSKIDPDEIRARAKQVAQDQRRLKMNKKLQQLKGSKKKRLQATKVSAEGRGMLKYL
ncbi:PREDICTED: protein IWS1 homolog 2-like [Tarenaya hassleriana]|uniref:protein IWS1 homolog 2-like n=1 Tax=Tarenaya hassleriana TaxID=28532 RepID=UPI00053C2C53|nr:PREDICTED: protein IWS1 homolog 2-like [Tarenaya hassleriana]